MRKYLPPVSFVYPINNSDLKNLSWYLGNKKKIFFFLLLLFAFLRKDFDVYTFSII